MAGAMRIGFWNKISPDLWVREYRNNTMARAILADKGKYWAEATGGDIEVGPELSFKDYTYDQIKVYRTLREAKEAAWELVKARAERIDARMKEKE